MKLGLGHPLTKSRTLTTKSCFDSNSAKSHTKSYFSLRQEGACHNRDSESGRKNGLLYVYKTKRETYNFYKEICHEKGEIPLGMGQFSKAFAEMFDEDIVREGKRVERVWLNIDFKRPKQEKLKEAES